MLMVIFGAGASYDSDPARRPNEGLPDYTLDRPPLADELFDNRQTFAEILSTLPECSPIVPLLRGTRGIEQRLERLQNEASGTPPYPHRLRQLAAVRWYLQVLLGTCADRWHAQAGGITNYLTLLDEIRRWGHQNVLFVTFNYDNLLERAVSQLTARLFTTIDDYVRPGEISVIKVHGSTNWGHVIENREPLSPELSAWAVAHKCIADAGEIKLSNEFVVSFDHPIYQDEKRRPLFPAIAIPVQSNSTLSLSVARFLNQSLQKLSACQC